MNLFLKVYRKIHIPLQQLKTKQNQYYMMMSSNGNIFLVTGPLWGEFTGHRWISLQMPVTRSFDVFVDLRLNKRWVNNLQAGDLRRHHTHDDVILMIFMDVRILRSQLHTYA